MINIAPSADAEIRPARQVSTTKHETGARKNTYLKVTLGKLTKPSGSPVQDGATLVEQCIDAINDLSQFPPQLLILWATPRFQPYRAVLAGIHNKLAERGLAGVPLIGSSVAVCLFDEAPHEDGAVLICLASRLLAATLAVGRNAQTTHERAVSQLLDGLGIRPELELNRRQNEFLITFLPGFAADGAPESYRAAEIVDELHKQTAGQIHLFGGISSAGLEPGVGSQFLGEAVYTSSAVAALVQSDITYGTGLLPGLKGTPDYYQVKTTEENGRAIKEFVGGSAAKIMAEIEDPKIFGLRTPLGDTVVIMPQLVGDVVKLQRNLSEGARLQVLRPDPETMRKSLGDLRDWVLKTFSIRAERFVAQIGIGCVFRYQRHLEFGFDLPRALRHFKQNFPSTTFVGCCMDGEIGIDKLGRPVLGNWSVADLHLADEVPAASRSSLGHRALAEYTASATTAPTVRKAMQQALKCIERAGYHGAMISLVLHDGEEQWIIAHEALGKGWQDGVLPKTQRRFLGKDALAIAAQEKELLYIRDATTDPRCDHVAALAGDVISFYAAPLLDHRKETIGVLQIDLGDMRDTEELSEDHRAVLVGLTAMTAAALNRAIQTDELALARRLDQAITGCLACDSPDNAAGCFVPAVARAIEAYAHVRLLVPGTTKLRLVGGNGRYYEAARQGRPEIDVNDPDSPTARSFRERKRILSNDAETDDLAKRMRQKFTEGRMGDALGMIHSFVNYPVGLPCGEPLGVLNIAFHRPWFFTQSLLRSLEDVSQRLYFLLLHIAQKQAEQRGLAQLRFLRSFTPRLTEGVTLFDALKGQVEEVRRAAKAQVVSCYLWDEVSSRFILRAQNGWADEGWVDAAWYARWEGMTGRLAQDDRASYIPHLHDDKSPKAEGKYIRQMFGEAVNPEHTFEVIALPLHFREKHLGIVTMHRQRPRQRVGFQTGFTSTDTELLTDAAEDLSAFVLSLQRYDETKWLEEERQRLAEIDQVLLQNKPLDGLLSDLCDAVVKQHKARLCAVYLVDGMGRALLRRAVANHLNFRRFPPEIVDARNDRLWRAFETRIVQEERRSTTLEQHEQAEVRKDGIIERVCLPLVVELEDRCLGVLDIHWRGLPRSSTAGVLPHHSTVCLANLAQHVASAVNKADLREEHAEALKREARALGALHGMAFSLLNSSHQMAKAAQEIQSGLAAVRCYPLTDQQQAAVNECLDMVESLASELGKARTIGSRFSLMERAPSPLHTLLHEAISGFDDTVRRKDITLSVCTPEVTATVDGAQMLDCFENLIDNAIRAMSRGGVLNIRLAEHKTDGLCEISFTDTGRGMHQDDIDEVLRGRPTVERTTGGRMGLLLARLYCEGHGGRLQIESAPGTGATVRMFIPLTEIGGSQ